MPRQSSKWTRSRIIARIKSVARDIKRTPTLEIIAERGGLPARVITDHFDSWHQAVRASGLRANPGGRRYDDDTLLAEWGRVARQVGKCPTTAQFCRFSTLSLEAIRERFGGWNKVPPAFTAWSARRPRWARVRRFINKAPAAKQTAAPRAAEPCPVVPAVDKCEPDNQVVGRPLAHPVFRYEPVNEMGVVLLFGMLARPLGFAIESVQPGFPDCIALREGPGGKWRRVRIEFEFESRSFARHGHEPRGCDLLVCWKHNWTACPPGLEVVELSKVVNERSAA